MLIFWKRIRKITLWLFHIRKHFQGKIKKKCFFKETVLEISQCAVSLPPPLVSPSANLPGSRGASSRRDAGCATWSAAVFFSTLVLKFLTTVIWNLENQVRQLYFLKNIFFQQKIFKNFAEISGSIFWNVRIRGVFEKKVVDRAKRDLEEKCFSKNFNNSQN